MLNLVIGDVTVTVIEHQNKKVFMTVQTETFVPPDEAAEKAWTEKKVDFARRYLIAEDFVTDDPAWNFYYKYIPKI